MTANSPRFFSLDVLRGMTVCFMIIVNTPGSAARPFAFLSHAHWNGFTPTDLVFPSFLFVVGNAMSFAIPKYVSLGNNAYLKKVSKRTLIIFLLGFLMYWFPFYRLDQSGRIDAMPFSDTRVFGVLQRIALCYFLASLIIRYFSEKWVYISIVFILAAYWIVLFMWGGTSDTLGLQNNAAYKLDHLLLSDSHLYHGNGGKAFDPEGLLSTFPAVVNVIGGYYTGRYLRNKGIGFEVIAKMLLAGVVLIFTALIWNEVLPINKKLWTGSFVLITIGLDLLILSFLIYVIDISHRRKWTVFFIPFGKNPLFIYLLSEILVIFLYVIPIDAHLNLFQELSRFFCRIIPGAGGSLLFALTYMLLCWCVSWWLDKRGVYIKV
jgi:predicted acyltransferase